MIDHAFTVWQVTNFLSLEEAVHLARKLSGQFKPYLLKHSGRGWTKYAIVRRDDRNKIPADFAILVTESDLVTIE